MCNISSMQASKRSNGFPLYLMPVLSALVLCVGPLRGPKLVRQYVLSASTSPLRGEVHAVKHAWTSSKPKRSEAACLPEGISPLQGDISSVKHLWTSSKPFSYFCEINYTLMVFSLRPYFFLQVLRNIDKPYRC